MAEPDTDRDRTMSVTEQLMKPGSWSVTLADPPKEVRDLLGRKGYIVIFPTRVDPRGVSDANLLTLARYSGVLQRRTVASDGRMELAGDGLASLMGDAEGKGGALYGAIFAGQGLSAWGDDILPTNGITKGTFTDTGATFTGTVGEAETVRAQLDRICAGCLAEWRINPTGTVDAAAPATLFADYTTPDTIAVRKEGGVDLNVTGLTITELGESDDANHWTSKVILVAEGEGHSTIFGEANNASNPYLGWGGAALVMERLVDSPYTEGGYSMENPIAAAALAPFASPERTISLSTNTYDVGRHVTPGGMMWVYDPDRGLVDTANQVTYRGQVLAPMKQRVFSYTWPLQRGMSVCYRTGAGVWTEVTDWVEWETGDTTFEVGAPARSTDPDIILPTSMTGPKTNHAIHERLRRGVPRGYTPVVTQALSTPAFTTNRAEWSHSGGLIHVSLYLSFTGAGTAGSGVRCTIPVAAAHTSPAQILVSAGQFYNVTAFVPIQAQILDLDEVVFTRTDAPPGGLVGVDPNFAIANTHLLIVSFLYVPA